MRKKEIEGRIFDALDRLRMGAYEGTAYIDAISKRRFAEDLAEVISAASEQRDLRDYFAAHAPIKLSDAIAYEYQATLPDMNDEERATVYATFARFRYAYADAMLAERAK